MHISFSSISEKEQYTNTKGDLLEDKLIGYNYETKEAIFERSKIPISTFSLNDQKYINQWNKTKGFLSTFRFKILMEKRDGIEQRTKDQDSILYGCI